MDIQAEKIELAKLILNTNDIKLINQIKSLFKDKEENWWDELPASVKQGINESIEQANRGEFISYDEVKKEVMALFKK
jgi:predicted transcriptional regulator